MSKLNSQLVLIKVDAPPAKDKEADFFIQEEWQTHPPTGTVEQVADDVTFCKKGDRVFFERYTAIPTYHGDDYRLCREDAVFEVLDEK